MNPKKRYKIVFYSPESTADAIRNAIGDVGAGIIGGYTHCTFTIKGTGRFKPGEGTHPTVGEVGKLAEVAEDRIETICEEGKLTDILKVIKQMHPYEEPAIDVYPIEVFE